MTAVSALIVARNEEANLAACLAACAFADEIVVVLDRSTDRSADIARAAGARVIEGAWPLEGPRRHAGIEACTGPWILEVDADERVTPALAEEIRRVIATAPPGCLQIGFDNHIGMRHIRHGWGAYNGISVKWSLFTKGMKSWGNERVHPAIAIEGSRGRLDARMIHYVDRDLGDLFARLNRYSDLAARDMADRGERMGGWAALRRFFSRGWKAYVVRKGYREGVYGVALGLFAALYPVLTHLKCEELRNRPDRTP